MTEQLARVHHLPARPDAEVLEGELVTEPSRLLPVVVDPIRRAVTHDVTKAAGRNVAYVLGGGMHLVREWWLNRTRADRNARRCELANDQEGQRFWYEQGRHEKQERFARWLKRLELAGRTAKMLGIAAVVTFGLLLVLGIVLWLTRATDGPFVPVIRFANFIAWMWWLLGATWVAFPVLTVAGFVTLLWRAGRQAGAAPTWLGAQPTVTRDDTITPSRIVLAVRELGIARLRKAVADMGDAGGGMLSPVRIAGCGIEVDVTLPPVGVTTLDVMNRRRRLAENLDRHEHEVHLSVAPSPPRTVRVWAADSGALDEPIGPSPMLADEEMRADYAAGRAPFGLSLRGDPVTMGLHQKHLLCAGMSAQGKTKTLRSLALWLALDPNVELWIADLKGYNDETGESDWEMFRDIASRFVAGPTDEHVIEYVSMLEDSVTEMKRRLVTPTRHKPLVVIGDECFPAGTAIGGRPIQSVRVGDTVPSWDEVTGERCDGKVTAIFSRMPQQLVCIHWQNGGKLVCTPNHPLMTRSGWRAAGSLDGDSEVLQYAQRCSVVEAREFAVHDVRSTFSTALDKAARVASSRPGLLHRAVRTRGDVESGDWQVSLGQRTGKYQFQHDQEQPHERSRYQGEGGRDPQVEGAPSPRSWRQRSRANCAAATAVGSAGRLAHGSSRGHQATLSQGWLSDALQAGHRSSQPEALHRGGRSVSQHHCPTTAGREEDRVAEWCGVDRVEVLEPGSDGRFGGLCPDRHVYNLEVAGTHTYLVEDGIVAHNCQVMYMSPARDAGGRHYGGSKATSRGLTAVRELHNQGRVTNNVLWEGTQDPSNQNYPVLARNGIHLRICTAISEESQARMVLQDKAVNAGARPDMLRLGADKGTVVVAGDGAPLADNEMFKNVRVHYIDDRDAWTIARRAVELRGPVTPWDSDEPRDLLQDVHEALGEDDEVLAAHLADRLRETGAKPYRALNGTQLVEQLAEVAVIVEPGQGRRFRVRADRVLRALDEREGVYR